MDGWNTIVSFSDDLFAGTMLVSERVYKDYSKAIIGIIVNPWKFNNKNFTENRPNPKRKGFSSWLLGAFVVSLPEGVWGYGGFYYPVIYIGMIIE